MTENDDTMTVRSVRRIVKLRFKCINQKCKNFHCLTETQKGDEKKYVLKDAQISKAQTKKAYVSKEEALKGEASKKENVWTSYYGLVDFRFYL